MTDAPADLADLLRRACLAFDARALHTGGPTGVHAAAFVNAVAADVLVAMDAAAQEPVRGYLADVYRHLSVAADNPMRQSCREREAMLNIACHGLAHALLLQPAGVRASEEEVHALLTDRWTASLLAWSEIFPSGLDGASGPCVCGALGTRPVLVPTGGR